MIPKIGKVYYLDYPGERGQGWSTDPWKGYGKCVAEEGGWGFNCLKGEKKDVYWIFAESDILKEKKTKKKK